MPEIPGVTIYVEALRERLLGHKLVRTSIRSPFLLRSTSPPVESANGRTAGEIRRVTTPSRPRRLSFTGHLDLHPQARIKFYTCRLYGR